MFDSTVSQLAAQWFDDYHRLAYWLARRWAQRSLAYRGRSYSGNELEELAQDAVCRGFDRFAKRCPRELCGLSVRKRWVCQCVTKGAHDAVRCKSCFGSITAPASVRDDVTNRCQRVDTGFTHGNDNEKQDALAQVACVPIDYPVQRWELELLIDRELPAHLRLTSLYAACGLTQEQSAILQSVVAVSLPGKPKLDAVAGQFRGVATAVEMYRRFVLGHVIDGVRNGFSIAGTGEIVIVDDGRFDRVGHSVAMEVPPAFPSFSCRC